MFTCAKQKAPFKLHRDGHSIDIYAWSFNPRRGYRLLYREFEAKQYYSADLHQPENPHDFPFASMYDGLPLFLFRPPGSRHHPL